MPFPWVSRCVRSTAGDRSPWGSPPERVVELFAKEVAVITLFPYLREALATITPKVFGTPITLPVAQRGQIGFEVTPAEQFLQRHVQTGTTATVELPGASPAGWAPANTT
ncbi:hypothetical protein [Arthrobacter sp. NA-172]|uniref:hypothetical protein n=1 Tax=Arthrobacter sp. NA-172 TaxID=3367524 RepID=UPI0037551C18